MKEPTEQVRVNKPDTASVKPSKRNLLCMIPTQAKPGETREQTIERILDNVKQAVANQNKITRS